MSFISSVVPSARPAVIHKEPDEISAEDRVVAEALCSLNDFARAQSSSVSLQNRPIAVSFPPSDSIPQARLENSSLPFSSPSSFPSSSPSGSASRKRKEPSPVQCLKPASSAPPKSKKKHPKRPKTPPYEFFANAFKDFIAEKGTLDSVSQKYNLNGTSFRHFRTLVQKLSEGTLSIKREGILQGYAKRFCDENGTERTLKRKNASDESTESQYEDYKKGLIEYFSRSDLPQGQVPQMTVIARKHQIDLRLLTEFVHGIENLREGKDSKVRQCRMRTFESLREDLKSFL